jgi:hypothetical protein
MARPGLRIWRSGVRISSGAPIANVVAAPLCAIEAPQHSLALLTVGADKNYDTADFVAGCRERGCTPHVSQNDTNRRSAIDARTTRHPGYRISTIKRKRIEEPSGGSRRSAVCARPGIVAATWSSGSSCSPRALQSRSHSEDAGSNGTSLSGASNMRQNRSENCACGAVYDPSIGSSSPRTSGKSPFKIHFSAACYLA